MLHVFRVIEGTAARTVIAQHRSVQLQHLFAACLLVQTVNILGDNRLHLPCPLQLSKLSVRRIRLSVQGKHLILVKPVEFIGLSHKEAMADNRLRRILVLDMIEAILAPEVRNSALRGNPRPSEEDNVIASINDLLQLSDFLRIHEFLLSRPSSCRIFGLPTSQNDSVLCS